MLGAPRRLETRASLVFGAVITAALTLPSGARAETPGANSPGANRALGQVEESRRLARELFDRGVQLSADGRWNEAEAVFARSAELVPSASCLLNLAVTRFQLRQFVAALEAISRFDALGADVSVEQVERARAIRERLKKQVVLRTLHVSPAHAETYVDGKRATERDSLQRLALDPGAHTLTFRANGYISSSVQINGEPGSSGELEIALAPAPALAAQSAAAVHNKPSSAPKLATSVTEPERDVSGRRSLWQSQWLWIGVGVLVVGAGATAYALSSGSEPRLGSEGIGLRPGQ